MLFMSCVCHAFTSARCCLVVTWMRPVCCHRNGRADLLALDCDIYCDFVTFPFGMLGQVWYLIVLDSWSLLSFLLSCTTTELSQLTSCLTAVINMLLSTKKRYMKDPVRIYFGLLKVLDKFKVKYLNTTSLSTYDVSTLYTTLPDTLI